MLLLKCIIFSNDLIGDVTPSFDTSDSSEFSIIYRCTRCCTFSAKSGNDKGSKNSESDDVGEAPCVAALHNLGESFSILL